MSEEDNFRELLSEKMPSWRALLQDTLQEKNIKKHIKIYI
jgi:hypothetical protein